MDVDAGKEPEQPSRPCTVDLTRTTTDAPSSLLLIREPSGATFRPRATAAPAPSSRAAARAVSRAASTTRTWVAANESTHASPRVNATSIGSTITVSAVTAPRSPRRAAGVHRCLRTRAAR